MDHPVKRIKLPPLPKARIFYEPECQVLIIENGESSEVAEEMAQGVLVHYDKDTDDAPTSAVAIRIDCAEVVLKPFVDAILAKYGIAPEKAAEPTPAAESCQRQAQAERENQSND